MVYNLSFQESIHSPQLFWAGFPLCKSLPPHLSTILFMMAYPASSPVTITMLAANNTKAPCPLTADIGSVCQHIRYFLHVRESDPWHLNQHGFVGVGPKEKNRLILSHLYKDCFGRRWWYRSGGVGGGGGGVGLVAGGDEESDSPAILKRGAKKGGGTKSLFVVWLSNTAGPESGDPLNAYNWRHHVNSCPIANRGKA